jgi:hypothetical protein
MCRITPTTVATNTESEADMKGTSEMQVSKGKYCKEAQIPWYLLVRAMPFDKSGQVHP